MDDSGSGDRWQGLYNPPDFLFFFGGWVHFNSHVIGFLRGGCEKGEGVFLGNPKDSGREAGGTLGNITGD